MNIYDKDFDSVINGVVATGVLTYREAIDKIVPLISKTEFQRKLQDNKFYEKLERDIINGCVMPPITLAFVENTINFKSEVIPVQDFTENSDIDWTKDLSNIDLQLYEKYKLSNEEIQFIEESIKPM